MRKVIWFCGALVVAAAGTGYLVADYAAGHPGSAVASCVVTCYRLGTDCNPVYQVGGAVQEQECHVAEPMPALQSPTVDSDDHHCVDSSASYYRLEPKIIVEEEIERTLRPRAGEEESEEPARVMPPAEENGSTQQRVMPYADDAEPRGFGSLPDCREDPNQNLRIPGCPLPGKVDTLDLRPSDMKPYKGEPVPF